MKLNFSPSSKPLTAWGIDLGTTNSTLCRIMLAADNTMPAEPEVLGLRQPTQAGTYIGTLVPSMVAIYQGQEFVGEGAKNLRALTAPPPNGMSRNVNLFHDCKNEIGTSRSYPNAPTPTHLRATVARRRVHRILFFASAVVQKIESMQQHQGFAGARPSDDRLVAACVHLRV